MRTPRLSVGRVGTRRPDLSPSTVTGLACAGLAAVGATAGGRFGRRAALRGSISSGLAGAVVALVALVSRRVALSLGVPSGVTAAAAGFAAGAVQELPAAAALAPVVAWAGLSDLRDGRASAAGVATGAVLGAAAAGLTRQFWPVAPRTPARIRRDQTRVGTEPSPEGAGLTIVVNPRAGWALAESPTEALRRGLPKAKVIEQEEGDDMVELLTAAAREARALGVAGGDGTINAGAGVALEHGKPLLVVPGGTLNHFARDLGLESVDDALEAVRRGHTVAVDVARIDGRPFLNTASIGSYVELVDARERLEDILGKWPAVVVSMWRVLRRSERLDLEIDGRHRCVWMIFVGNCRYHPSGFAPSWRETLDDGQLDVRILGADQPWARARLLLAVLTGRLGRCRVYEQIVTRRVEINSPDGPLRLARDGEVFDGSTTFVIDKVEERLGVFLPEPSG